MQAWMAKGSHKPTSAVQAAMADAANMDGKGNGLELDGGDMVIHE